MIKKTREMREKNGETLNLMEKTNLVRQFRNTVKEKPDSCALMSRYILESGESKWEVKTYAQFAEIVNCIAASLLEDGVKMGDRVAIQSHTREEWAIIDEAILGVGCVTTCLYPSLAPSMVQYQLDDSDSFIAFIETRHHFETILELKEKLPRLRKVIIIEDPSVDDPSFEFPSWLVTYDDYIKAGKKILKIKQTLKVKIESFMDKIDPDSLATIVYTSGTTGMPKGAMLTHWNIASNCISVHWFSGLTTLKRNLSFLPLSHVLERMAGHFYPIMIGMCTAFALDLDNLSRDLQEVEPDYLVGVPRVFEKIYAFAMQSVQEYPAVKQKIFWWAVKVGKTFNEKFRMHQKIGIGLRIKMNIARMLVFKKFVEMTGGNLLFFVSGGASMPEELARFYGAVGLTIIEGYGLTETSPVTNMNDPLDIVFGTVGPPIPGTEIKIAPDGEILVKGPQVFKGYWKKPEQTKAVLSDDGWFHTGDLGEWDEKGNLKIIGRKKEIFVLSTGKKVPPIFVEDQVAIVQFIQQLVLIGDGKKFISALITPNFSFLESHLRSHEPDLASQMPDFKSASEAEIEEFLYKPEIKALFESDIQKINENLDPYAQIKKFEIIPHELTEETGDLTPSMKFKRRKIAEHYKDKIDRMYEKDLSVRLSDDGVQITELNDD
ncbi:MAG: AMP-dependent synthetase/ligase [Promethearchaeota archaeon]